ncbi:VanZ family protein [Kocuria soli]|uniref:VanZ family protein n=1 Tax=Kocuria soli TaxID=2485125 RepID=A0A3N3ZPZ0_9MICC|nr:VanZ family protein [Kocuria soli]
MNLDLWLTLRSWGAPRALGPDQTEFGLNVLIFTVGVVLAAAAFPRVHRSVWVFVAVVASGAVEGLQGFVLPDREMDWLDLLANSTGAILGAVLVMVFVRGRARSQDRRRRNHGRTRGYGGVSDNGTAGRDGETPSKGTSRWHPACGWVRCPWWLSCWWSAKPSRPRRRARWTQRSGTSRCRGCSRRPGCVGRSPGRRSSWGWFS